MRIAHIKPNAKTSRITRHTTGGGKKRAHNIKGSKMRHGRSR